MNERFIRTGLILGEAGMNRLAKARVAVFGVGGVGGHCVQALARAGVGALDVFDDDVVSVTNINRQAVAMTSTIGGACAQDVLYAGERRRGGSVRVRLYR